MFIEEANKLLEPGYLPLETGYMQLSNGQWLVAVLTRMPGVTGKMLDWWMASYLDSTEKYKLWDSNHLRFEWDDKKKPGQFIGATHICEEMQGDFHLAVRIKFEDPAMYLDTSRFAEAKIQTAVACTVYSMDWQSVYSRIIWVARTTEDGVEQRFRAWDTSGTPESACGGMTHTIGEMARQAQFLPTLYATNGKVFLKPGEAAQKVISASTK
jgi:hypothetical protein